MRWPAECLLSGQNKQNSDSQTSFWRLFTEPRPLRRKNGLHFRSQWRWELSPETHNSKALISRSDLRVWPSSKGINLASICFPMTLTFLFCSVLAVQSTFSEESSPLIKKATPHSSNQSSQQLAAAKVACRFKALLWTQKWIFNWGHSVPSSIPGVSVEPYVLVADCLGSSVIHQEPNVDSCQGCRFLWMRCCCSYSLSICLPLLHTPVNLNNRVAAKEPLPQPRRCQYSGLTKDGDRNLHVDNIKKKLCGAKDGDVLHLY